MNRKYDYYLCKNCKCRTCQCSCHLAQCANCMSHCDIAKMGNSITVIFPYGSALDGQHEFCSEKCLVEYTEKKGDD